MCGGTSSPAETGKRGAGLSPRGRGNRIVGRQAPDYAGSIPACAGEPSWVPICRFSFSGLSPRVRGNLRRVGPEYVKSGSIPACAGEPATTAQQHLRCRVYPRVCGGTERSDPGRERERGLSPRVRGNRHRARLAATQMGSIPACAGEPYRLSAEYWSQRVYPRVCGGTPQLASELPQATGLSPRVRGNHYRQAGAGRNRGSIPACAGEPSAAIPPGQLTRVYPRVCGGTRQRKQCGEHGKGLSPRVRGNRPSDIDGRSKLGSIPACAGEPAARRTISP